MKFFTCLSILVFCILHSTNSFKFRCDYKYCKESDAWFKHHNVPATWPDARLMCTFEGGILAAPTSPEIRDCMMNSYRTLMFTGFHATISQGSYVSVDGIRLEKNSHGWVIADKMPNNYKGGCLAMDANGLFMNVDCYEPRPYMCYKKMTKDPTACGTTDIEYHLDMTTNKCYKFHTIPRNFSRANFACTAEGGHLAIINSEAEAKALKKLFASYPKSTMIGKFWKDIAFIGFHDWGERGDWRTMHGQTLKAAGYEIWDSGEPNNLNPGEFCGSIYRNGKLNDLACEDLHAFICEKRPEYPPLCGEDGKPAITGFTPKRREFDQIRGHTYIEPFFQD